jgi:hypothetical protein
VTVTELICNFRAGLLGLLPSIERVGIPWKRPDAYDEWDNLAAAVYHALIVEPLRSSLPESEQEHFRLPEYDLLLSSYSGRSVIEILPPGSGRAIRVFHAFGTAEAPFDLVEWRTVLLDGTPGSDSLESGPVEGARFALRMYTGGRSADHIECIKIPSGPA